LTLLPSNSFYSSFAKKKGFTGGYQAPVNSAWAGVANAAPKPASAPPSAPSGGSPSSSTGAPASFGLPPDPAYQAAIGALQGSRDNTEAGLAQQRAAGLSAYGYTEDPNTHAIAFDPNNPYSQAALMRKRAEQAKTGNTTSYAAAGQLYAGSLQNAQNANTDQFNQSNDALTKAVQNFLAQNTIAANAAGDAYNSGAAGALGDSVARASAAPAVGPPAIDPATAGLKFGLAPGYELYRDPVTGELKARKVGG
jgi:hypothetical protein